MYNLTLEINQVCNLKCRYCYLGKKNEGKMSITIAKKAINMAFDIVAKHRQKILYINFVGGEALLDFELIKQIVEYIEEKDPVINIKVVYSVTTNATIFSEQIIHYLCDKNFNLKISIDGRKEVNDLNRIAKGFSVHDCIIKNLPLIKYYEKETNKYVQVTNVITGNNYKEYVNSLKYLTGNLGFKIIDTAIDTSYPWNENEMIVLEEQIIKSVDYFEKTLDAGCGFFWSFADDLIRAKEKSNMFYLCGAGIVSCYIKNNGNIFPCVACLENGVSLGNVETGILMDKVNKLKEIKSIDNVICNNCDIYDYCSEKSCVMENIAFSGDKNKVVPIMCYLRKLKNRLYNEKEELMVKWQQIKKNTYEMESKNE